MTGLVLPTARDEAWRYADFAALEALAPEAFGEWKEVALAPGETRRKCMVLGGDAPELHRIRLENRSLYDVLRRQYGLRIVRAERWIDAVLPDATTHALLQMAEPEPLLQIESIAYGSNGRPLEHYRALHRCRSSRLHVQTTT